MKPHAAIVALVLAAAAVAAGPATPEPGRFWIRNATIVSPDRLDRVVTGSVLVERGRIARVAERGAASAPAGATVVDGTGLFLVPGLIDSHVHLASVPGMDTGMGSPAVLSAYFRQLPRSYLYFGYTTLFDLAVVDRQVLIDFAAAPAHPDLYHCGPSLPVANGYPMAFAPPEARFSVFTNAVFDPAHPTPVPVGFRPEDHTPEAAVLAVKRAGGSCVKTYFERGFGSLKDLPVPSPDLLAGIRAAAAREQLPLLIHANSFEAQSFAVDGGVDVIAHGLWNWGALNDRRDLPPDIAAMLDRVVAKGIGYQPTIQVIAGMQAYVDPGYLKQPAVSKVVPPMMLAWFQSPEGRWFRKEIADDRDPDEAVKAGLENGPLRRVRAVVAYLASKGATFLFGTDTPSAPNYGNLPGLNGYLEMQQLRRAGLSLEQIFRAATIDNARRFHLDGEVGTIAPGKVANLLLLRRSPLESVEAYDAIVSVWLHGTPLDRGSLVVDNGGR